MKLYKTWFPATILVAVLGVTLWFWHDRHRPKRVWVTYSEKYDGDQASAKKDDPLYAEERLGWLIEDNQGCIVLTHEKRRADYLVEISVIRDIDSKVFARANLSVTKRNGDVLLTDSFYQDMKSKEDIGQQPISRTWEILCSSALSETR